MTPVRRSRRRDLRPATGFASWSLPVLVAVLLASSSGIALAASAHATAIENVDAEKALLQKAIDGGDITLGFEKLGDFYRSDTPEQDLGKAVDAYRSAADAGNTAAMRKLAWMLAKGEGVPPDQAAAETLFRRAVAAGDVRDGAQDLGDFYVFLPSSADARGKALDSYQLAGDAGNAEAHLAAAEILADAIDVGPVRKERIFHLAAAATIVGPRAMAVRMMSFPKRLLVFDLQQMLAEAGFSPANVDGVLGAPTEDAIKAYCRSRSVQPCRSTVVSIDVLARLLEEPR